MKLGATLEEMAAWVRATLGDDFPRDTNGVWQAGDGRAVARLGVGLAGNRLTAGQLARAGVDALLLHRPWGLGEVPPGVGVLAVHEALDERLTTGENPWLAERLGFVLGEGIGARRGRPLVSLARRATPMPLGELLARVGEELGEGELWNPQPLTVPVQTIALANAMRPALVAVAASQGASLYLTGALRPAARPFLLQTEMAAVGLGHHATERWGLRWLARGLEGTFGVEIVWLDESAL